MCLLLRKPPSIFFLSLNMARLTFNRGFRGVLNAAKLNNKLNPAYKKPCVVERQQITTTLSKLTQNCSIYTSNQGFEPQTSSTTNKLTGCLQKQICLKF